MADTEYTRLHITPLNPSILPAIIPPSILPRARNISYHTIQTFPERAYGYVELPLMEAEKLKKKLNGSILKGTKVRIEKARPEKVVNNEDAALERPPKEKKSSKRKRETVPGVEIGERSVKRGWTAPSAKLDKRKEKGKPAFSVKSKYTTGKECLFKTILPPNVASNVPVAAANEVKLEKRKSKKGKEAVVHEFAKTTKYATFLRSSAGEETKGVAEYIEGKGWVDADGRVVEESVKRRRAPSRKSIRKAVENVVSHTREKESDSDDSAAEEDVSDIKQNDASSNESKSEDGNPMLEDSGKILAQSAKAFETSSSGSNEDSEASSSSDEAELQVFSTSEDEVSTFKNTPRLSSSALKIKIPDPTLTVTPANSVHPLEALYKRPKPIADENDTKPAPPSFTFFDAGGDDDLDKEAADQVQIPMTPFTQRDFEYRGIRSAAPTPDTSHANKRFIWPTDKDKDNDEEDGGDGEESSPTRKGESSKMDAEKSVAPESDFQKWFWENRGEANRAWKKRRKTVAKEKRQRENRKRGDQTA